MTHPGHWCATQVAYLHLVPVVVLRDVHEWLIQNTDVWLKLLTSS